MNYLRLINKATTSLKRNLIQTANIDAELLLLNLLNKKREDILLNLNQKVNRNQIKKYINLIKRRKKKEPVSLITGKRFFWKNEFIVNNNVLTPRFETEILIEEILKIYKHIDDIRILEFGVGSGCIIVSLLKEKEKWRGKGIDVSNMAIKISKTNAKIQQVDNRIQFLHSDIDKFSSGKYDLIVSNPPYINKIGYNNLDIGVKKYEPPKALYGGIDGVEIIEKVINKSKIVLKNNGLLAMEIGLGQHYKVSEILKNNGFYIMKIIKDYQNIKRCIFAKKIK